MSARDKAFNAHYRASIQPGEYLDSDFDAGWNAGLARAAEIASQAVMSRICPRCHVIHADEGAVIDRIVAAIEAEQEVEQ